MFVLRVYVFFTIGYFIVADLLNNLTQMLYAMNIGIGLERDMPNNSYNRSKGDFIQLQHYLRSP